MAERKYRNRKCLDELFTVEEFRLANDIRYSYDCGYCPVALIGTSQITMWCSSGLSLTRHITLRFYYAIQVWVEALLALSKEVDSDFCFGRLVWERGESGFRFVKFERESAESLNSKIARFWEILRKIADSKRIFVSEQIMRGKNIPKGRFHENDDQIEITYIVDKDDISLWHGHMPDLSDYNFSSEKKTYSWDEIKDLFVEISPRVLSLVHYDKMNYYDPDDAATIALHKACEAVDIDAAARALQDGADPNGFDEGGDTPLVHCVEWFYRQREENGKVVDKTKEEIEREINARISIMKLLLENGADIDFYGADCYNALMETYFPEVPEIMKFLLENGADPNHNCEIIDEPHTWYIHSSVLSEVLGRITFEEFEYDGKANDNLLAMEKLLNEYGAKLYIDGFNPDEYFKKD
ncbi:MAG: hypothetical protein IJI37_07545 [Opitutales bacterium]|nr:hypothetical protein [Opitutales bacterium]